jgi:hypothetical protein
MRYDVPKIVSLSVHIYRWLMSVGPAEFRRDYREPLVQVFRQCCLDAYAQRGMMGVLGQWLPMFSELVIGMLAERLFSHQQNTSLVVELALHERIVQMLRTLRRSMIAVFCAFIVFALPWLFFARMNDPLSWWEPIVRIHPEVNVILQVIQFAGMLAFLLLLVGGLPILVAAIRYAFVTQRRDVLRLLSISAIMLLLFAVVCVLVLTNNWGFDPNGGLFALISLCVVVAVTITLSRAIGRSELSERILRFALFPAMGLTLAMGVVLVASLVEAWLLSMDAPHVFTSSNVVNWIVADGMMVIALLVAGIALYRGLRTRTPGLA